MVTDIPSDFDPTLSLEIAELALRGDTATAIAKAESILTPRLSEEALSRYQWDICYTLIRSGEFRVTAWLLEKTDRFLWLPHLPEKPNRKASRSRLFFFYAFACRQANVPVMELLVTKYKIDPSENYYEYPVANSLTEAILSMKVEAVRWLLDHGVSPNHDSRGKKVSPALCLAAYYGLTEICQLLVERGAEVNCINTMGMGPLDLAGMGKHTETIAYLKSVGAQPSWQIRGESGPPVPPVIVETVLGQVHKWPNVHCIDELASDLVRMDWPLSIYRFERPNGLMLVTDGMSNRPFARGLASEPEFARAELLVYLQEDHLFLMDEEYYMEEMGEPERAIVDWIMEIARLSEEENGWLGPAAVIVNGDPAEPLWPGSPFTSVLAVTPKHDTHMRWVSPTGDIVRFYTLVPLYAQEREYEKKHGVNELLHRMTEAGISFEWNPERPCVV